MEDPSRTIQAALYGAVDNRTKEIKRQREIWRKVNIIAWLLPRFHSGLSDPKNYEELIGRVDDEMNLVNDE